ncbi:MAG: NAD(P)-dependent oxidoreductase [Xenophilus sp.]
MKVLVTGATSGLGRNAVDGLQRSGTPLRATGRDLVQGRALQKQGVVFEPADLACITPQQAQHLLRGVDAVWHCAALSAPWGRVQDFEAANVRATMVLAQAAAARGLSRFIHVSTPSIYFDYRHHEQIPESYRAARFANAYASSKARAEDVILRLAARHPHTRFTILRPRALFGPHDRVILPRLLALLRRCGGVLPLPGGGRARMDFSYVGNVVQAMHLATTVPGLASGKAFNITNQQPFSLAELLQGLLGEHWGIDYRIRPLPYPLLAGTACVLEGWSRLRGREPAFTRYSMGALHYGMTLDNRKAQEQLGYFPEIDMRQAVRYTADWHREHGAHHGL